MVAYIEDIYAYDKTVNSLSRSLVNDKIAYLQLILSLCKKNTFNRIVNCPTYPSITLTSDLKDRSNLLYDVINMDKYKISEILAKLYESSTKRKNRKLTGQYFTPNYIAKKAIEYLELNNENVILDPGCGTGIFPIMLLKEKPNINSSCYIGIENDPLLAISTALSLDIVDAPNHWKILYANFLQTNIDDIYNILDQIKFNIREINTIITNPPYVRQQKIFTKKLDEYKPEYISSLSGLHSLFLNHSFKLIKKGTMVFVLPIEMHGTLYGKKLLKKVYSQFIIKNIFYYYDKIDSKWHKTTLKEIKPDKLSTINQIWNIMFLKSRSINLTYKAYSMPKINNKKYMSLSYIGKIHRGISTGFNKYFVLSNQQVNKIGIDKKDQYLKKIIPTRLKKDEIPLIFDINYWHQLLDQNKPCWLLSIPKNIHYETLPNNIKKYLKEGIKKGIHLKPTCLKRTPWYSIRINKIPDLFFTYISRGYPKFFYNKAKVHCLTNLLGFHLTESLQSSDLKFITFTKLLNLELRKWADENSVGRKYSAGFVKFEPQDLMNLPIDKNKFDSINLIPSLDNPLFHS